MGGLGTTEQMWEVESQTNTITGKKRYRFHTSHNGLSWVGYWYATINEAKLALEWHRINNAWEYDEGTVGVGDGIWYGNIEPPDT